MIFDTGHIKLLRQFGTNPIQSATVSIAVPFFVSLVNEKKLKFIFAHTIYKLHKISIFTLNLNLFRYDFANRTHLKGLLFISDFSLFARFQIKLIKQCRNNSKYINVYVNFLHNFQNA